MSNLTWDYRVVAWDRGSGNTSYSIEQVFFKNGKAHMAKASPQLLATSLQELNYEIDLVSEARNKPTLVAGDFA